MSLSPQALSPQALISCITVHGVVYLMTNSDARLCAKPTGGGVCVCKGPAKLTHYCTPPGDLACNALKTGQNLECAQKTAMEHARECLRRGGVEYSEVSLVDCSNRKQKWTCRTLVYQVGAGAAVREKMSDCYEKQLRECHLAEAAGTTPSPATTSPTTTTTTTRATTTTSRSAWVAWMDAEEDRPEPASPSVAPPTPGRIEGQIDRTGLKAVNTSLRLVLEKLDRVTEFAAVVYAKCLSEDDESEAIAAKNSSAASSDAQVEEVPGAEGSSPKPDVADGLAEPEEPNARSKRDPERILILPSDVRPKKKKPSPEELSVTLTRVLGALRETMVSVMEGVRQELMQVPGLYITPLVDRLESRLAGLENLAHHQRRAADAVVLVQRESRRTLARIEDWANATLLRERTLAEAKSKRFAIEDGASGRNETLAQVRDLLSAIGRLREEQLALLEQMRELKVRTSGGTIALAVMFCLVGTVVLVALLCVAAKGGSLALGLSADIAKLDLRVSRDHDHILSINNRLRINASGSVQHREEDGEQRREGDEERREDEDEDDEESERGDDTEGAVGGMRPLAHSTPAQRSVRPWTSELALDGGRRGGLMKNLRTGFGYFATAQRRRRREPQPPPPPPPSPPAMELSNMRGDETDGEASPPPHHE